MSFNFLVAISVSKALGSGTRGSAVYIYVCLTSSTQCIFNSWEKWFLHLAKKKKTVGVSNQIMLLIPCYNNFRLVTLLKIIDVPIQVSTTFDLIFRYSLLFFLKCLVASRLKLFRLYSLLCFGSCNHCILAWFFRSKYLKHSSSIYGLFWFSSFKPRLRLAEILLYPLIFFSRPMYVLAIT